MKVPDEAALRTFVQEEEQQLGRFLFSDERWQLVSTQLRQETRRPAFAYFLRINCPEIDIRKRSCLNPVLTHQRPHSEKDVCGDEDVCSNVGSRMKDHSECSNLSL